MNTFVYIACGGGDDDDDDQDQDHDTSPNAVYAVCICDNVAAANTGGNSIIWGDEVPHSATLRLWNCSPRFRDSILLLHSVLPSLMHLYIYFYTYVCWLCVSVDAYSSHAHCMVPISVRSILFFFSFFSARKLLLSTILCSHSNEHLRFSSRIQRFAILNAMRTP